MTETIGPGVESYGCQLVQVPAGGLLVHREDVYFGAGGHHVLLYRTPYSAIPERDEQGAALDATEAHDCSMGVTQRWKVDAVIGGSEILGGEGLLNELPPGVALRLPPRAVLVMSTHFLNTSAAPLAVDARVNLYTIPAAELVVEAGLLYLDNPILRVPAMGASTARMRCAAPTDVSIVSLQSHMHARGVGFEATAISPGGEIEPIYATSRWIEPPVHVFEPPLKLVAGSSVELRCDYENTEPRTVLRGPSSVDEMCQLIGPYFPRDVRFEACMNEAGRRAALWIGEGYADGAATLACLSAAAPVEVDQGDSSFACVLGSCPGVAEEVSALINCYDAGRREGCAKACDGADAAHCQSCMGSACMKEASALGAAACE